ncbi:hypothetical protein [Desulfurivibrio sp. C05AmB]|uniref:hypothetical protein n=1 Tax=Desulfurivibrio sp. C05AmB TaxID=3374371 RepID=UPI00376EEEE8
MSLDAFSRWANRFRRDAVKDDMKLLRKHLQRVGLPDEPEKLIDGTIMYMSGCCAYLNIDGRSIDDFLAMQQYRPDVDADADYFFTFNLFGKTFGRIIMSLYPHYVDLADLYGHPWNDFKMCGYSDFRVARIDDDDMSADECDEIEKVVAGDILFDYTEDEIDIHVDNYSIEGILICYVQDVMREDMEMEYSPDSE